MSRRSIKSFKPKIVESPQYTRGDVDPRDIGVRLGTYIHKAGAGTTRSSIISIGPVMVGIQPYIVGVCFNLSWIFFGRDGRLWKLPGVKLPNRVRAPRTTDPMSLRCWADVVVNDVRNRLCPPLEVELVNDATRRYRRIVRKFVEQRISEAKDLGLNRESKDFARAVSEHWTSDDLLSPRHPTLRHSLYVSLVLSLPAGAAAELIEFAALMEFNAPIVTRETGLNIYQQAVNLLSKLSPEWWNQGAFLDWSYIGSLDLILREQYANILTNANHRGIDIHSAAGLFRTDPLGSSHRRTNAQEE